VLIQVGLDAIGQALKIELDPRDLEPVPTSERGRAS
jgi:hypothetical protein